jgi:hypothetical protein
MTGKQRTFARVLFVLYLVAVAWLCFGKFSSVPDVPRSFWGIPTDKVVHFLMFLPFPLLAYGALGVRPRSFFLSLLLVAGIFAAGCVLSGGTEVVQSFLYWRSGDLRDFEADALALGISSGIVLLIETVRQIRRR